MTNPRHLEFWGLVVGILALLFTIIQAVTGVISILPSFRSDVTQTPQPTVTPLAFSPEGRDETLIVIASFYYSEGLADTEAHHEIRRAIQEAKEELGLSNPRVEVEPTRLRADDRDGAQRLGERYNASMVIWGADTGVRITVNFLNLKHPDFDAAEVQISETERTLISNPSGYVEFVTRDLPGQLTFLSLFAIGQSYYIKGAYADSLEVIQKAVGSVVPGMESLEGLSDAYFLLGWLHLGLMGDDEQVKGDLDHAIADFDRAIDIKPDFAEAYNNRGNAYADKGDLAHAIADYDQAIALKPDFAEAYNNRGLAYADKGDLAHAIADYDQGIDIKPDFAMAYNNRGVAYADKGDLARAIADYDQAIDIKPDYALAYYNRGVAYAHKGDLDHAIADYDQAIDIKRDDADAYYNRGAAYADKGDLAHAIADYDQAIALKPGLAEAYNSRGLAYADKGDLAYAIADFDQAIARKPDYAKAYYNRGTAYAYKGDLDHAIADYDQAIDIKPDCADAYYNRGLAYALKGETAKAVIDFTKVLELSSDPQLRQDAEAELQALGVR